MLLGSLELPVKDKGYPWTTEITPASSPSNMSWKLSQHHLVSEISDCSKTDSSNVWINGQAATMLQNRSYFAKCYSD